ncbi:MAG TPA: KEOPS complex subunit Pcc1 [Nitrososphaerales archaeon]
MELTTFHHSQSQPFSKQIKIQASIEVYLERKIVLAVAEALKPELKNRSDKFVKTKVKIIDDTITLTMKPSSISDLRAGLNAYINLIKASSEAVSSVPLHKDLSTHLDKKPAKV